MPPVLATWLTLVGVVLLLRHETRTAQARSPALWIPVLWLGITGSRFVSQWMELGSPASDSGDGSPIDALYFGLLIVAAWAVLARRRVSLLEVIRANRWLFAMFLFGVVSITWSEFPFIAFKRLIKTLGHPLIALIILTDPDPAAALRTVLKRCAYILMPISVLFIKYLPQYGRGFDNWTGAAVNNGIGLNKNGLGYICMTIGIFYAWNVLTALRLVDRAERRREIGLSIILLWMTIWLLDVSNSATSLMTMTFGIFIMILLGWPFVSKRFGMFTIVVTLAALGLESTFDIYAKTLEWLGRDATLTDRTAVWADALALQDRPLLGMGFESFWMGSRLDVLWAKWWWQPNQAHNGYIETYLNFGYVGVALLGAVLLSTFRKSTDMLLSDPLFARLRLAFWFAIVFFNYTEAAFKGVHFIWTIFYLIAMDYPRHPVQDKPNAETPRDGDH